MTQDVSRRRRRYLQYRLSSLFWMALVVASFFFGRAWNDFGLKWKCFLSADRVYVRLRLDGSKLITRQDLGIPQMMVDDPSVCSATPLSKTHVAITGCEPGKTRVTVWYEGREDPVKYEVVVGE